MSKQKKITSPAQERRLINGELRILSDDRGKKIVGYAAKFSPTLSADLGGWREQIDPHAFDAALAAKVDCRALWNHDANHVLGRTSSGTLRLSVDSIGLRYEIDPPDTQIARDLMVSMERGDITQSSFGFLCSLDRWSEGPNGIVRTVLQVDEIFDVSPVTFPAYPDATSGVRNSLRSCPADLRSKLTRDDEDEDEDDDDIDGDDDREVCAACGLPIPRDEDDDEDEEERQAHLDLIIRKLRY